jgi:hypothetical protein
MAEERIIRAMTHWIETGQMLFEREAGELVAELSLLLLAHNRLFDAARVLIRYGWLAFHVGQSQRIGRMVYQVIEREA